MATTSYDSDFGFSTEQVVIPAGYTAAVFIQGNAAGVNDMWINQVSGGSLFILADGTGSTMAASALLTAGATTGGFLVPAGAFHVPGPANFYLAAPGASGALVSVMYGTR